MNTIGTKIDKQNLPIIIGIVLSLITFFVIFIIGAAAVRPVYTVFGLVVGVWIGCLLLMAFVPKSRQYLSFSGLVNAFLFYMGVLFISLSHFKEEISKVPLDLSMIGIGLALIGIASASSVRSQQQKLEDKNPAEHPSSSKVGEGEKTPATEQEVPSLDIVLDEVRRTLDFQFEQLDGLATKSGIVLGTSGVILTLLVTSLLATPSGIANSPLLVKVALAPIVLSLILAFYSISIQKWQRPPQLERLRSYYIAQPADKTRLRIVDISMDAIDKNNRRVNTIVNILQASYYVLGIGLLLLVVWFGTAVWH